MLESIIKDEIMAYFSVNNLFFKQQHSFRPRMSCVTELYAVDHWTKALGNGNDVDIIYESRFRKAFDCCPHQHLLSIS